MDFLYFLGGLHGIIIMVVVLAILYADHQGYRYFTGKVQTLPTKRVRSLHIGIFVGLALMIVTGVILTIPAWEYRLAQPVFYLKLGFVLVLVMNSYAIGKLMDKSTMMPFANLDESEKKTLVVSGVLSFCGWLGAIVIGFFFL